MPGIIHNCEFHYILFNYHITCPDLITRNDPSSSHKIPVAPCQSSLQFGTDAFPSIMLSELTATFASPHRSGWLLPGWVFNGQVGYQAGPIAHTYKVFNHHGHTIKAYVCIFVHHSATGSYFPLHRVKPGPCFPADQAAKWPLS